MQRSAIALHLRPEKMTLTDSLPATREGSGNAEEQKTAPTPTGVRGKAGGQTATPHRRKALRTDSTKKREDGGKSKGGVTCRESPTGDSGSICTERESTLRLEQDTLLRPPEWVERVRKEIEEALEVPVSTLGLYCLRYAHEQGLPQPVLLRTPEYPSRTKGPSARQTLRCSDSLLLKTGGAMISETKRSCHSEDGERAACRVEGRNTVIRQPAGVGDSGAGRSVFQRDWERAGHVATEQTSGRQETTTFKQDAHRFEEIKDSDRDSRSPARPRCGTKTDDAHHQRTGSCSGSEDNSSQPGRTRGARGTRTGLVRDSAILYGISPSRRISPCARQSPNCSQPGGRRGRTDMLRRRERCRECNGPASAEDEERVSPENGGEESFLQWIREGEECLRKKVARARRDNKDAGEEEKPAKEKAGGLKVEEERAGSREDRMTERLECYWRETTESMEERALLGLLRTTLVIEDKRCMVRHMVFQGGCAGSAPDSRGVGQ